MNDISYVNYLYALLDKKTSEYTNKFKLNLYLTLLSLNSHNYSEDIYKKEINIMEDYLRKTNNYKVKIQLKRKEEEINKLLEEIKQIYENNKNIIDKYNKENLNIITILESKEPKEITTLIDKLTKEKMKKVNNLNNYKDLMNNIISNINKYHIESNNLIINNNMMIPLDDFYNVFDYLINIDNYKDIYSNDIANNSHKIIINDIIEMINNNNLDNINNNILIPIILNYIISSNIPNYEEIATDKFHIDNIKISDLYSLANNNNINNNNKVMWRKIIIPNSYLYSKLNETINKGMYYFKDDDFIIESIGDFKVSISINSMISFIKDNLNHIVNC